MIVMFFCFICLRNEDYHRKKAVLTKFIILGIQNASMGLMFHEIKFVYLLLLLSLLLLLLCVFASSGSYVIALTTTLNEFQKQTCFCKKNIFFGWYFITAQTSFFCLHKKILQIINLMQKNMYIYIYNKKSLKHVTIQYPTFTVRIHLRLSMILETSNKSV